jgi:hypothetical protein
MPRRPSRRDIAEEDRLQLKQQRDFRVAADAAAAALASFPEVQKIALFGSVARPLVREVPRFQPYRRLGIEVLHECSDVDLAVWLTSVDRLRELGRARSQATSRLFDSVGVGVAHHQVDVFLFAVMSSVLIATSGMTISVTSPLQAEPAEPVRLPIQIGPPEALQKNSFVRIQGLPPEAALSEGHALLGCSPARAADPLHRPSGRRARSVRRGSRPAQHRWRPDRWRPEPAGGDANAAHRRCSFTPALRRLANGTRRRASLRRSRPRNGCVASVRAEPATVTASEKQQGPAPGEGTGRDIISPYDFSKSFARYLFAAFHSGVLTFIQPLSAPDR